MQLEGYLRMQEDLDQCIMNKKNIKLPKDKLITNILLALIVEVGELANEDRGFKYWSNKGKSAKDIILDEYIDIFHFWLSLGNKYGFTEEEIKNAYFRKNELNRKRADNKDY